MMELAQNMHLKKQKIKEKIEVLERSTIVNPKSYHVFSIVSDESAAYVNFYMGSIIAHILWK
jgi:predicted transcriptional regulator